MEVGSKLVATAAIKMALSLTRQEESILKSELLEQHDVKAVAVDYGGEFISSISKIVERAVVAAKREGVIKDNHAEEGAVAGAAREAISQLVLPGIRIMSVWQYF